MTTTPELSAIVMELRLSGTAKVTFYITGLDEGRFEAELGDDLPARLRSLSGVWHDPTAKIWRLRLKAGSWDQAIAEVEQKVTALGRSTWARTDVIFEAGSDEIQIWHEAGDSTFTIHCGTPCRISREQTSVIDAFTAAIEESGLCAPDGVEHLPDDHTDGVLTVVAPTGEVNAAWLQRLADLYPLQDARPCVSTE